MDQLLEYQSSSSAASDDDDEDSVGQSIVIDFLGLHQNTSSKELDTEDKHASSEQSATYKQSKGVPEVTEEKQLLWDSKVSQWNMTDAASAELPDSAFWASASMEDICLRREMQPSQCNKLENAKPKACNKRYISCDPSWDHRNIKMFQDPDTWFVKTHENQSYPKDSVDTKSAETRKLFYIHQKLASRFAQSGANVKTFLPRKICLELDGHFRTVNRVKWCVPQFSHLLLSCSMDKEICIWNVWTQFDKCVQRLTHHKEAVRDASWSGDGRKCLSSSYDKTAALLDVETGQCISSLAHQAAVSCGLFHPEEQSLCLTGSRNCVLSWDIRQPADPVHTYTYKDKVDQVEDIIFNRNGDTFFTCCNLVSRDSADRSVMAWDFASGTVLSNQIFQERYTCTRLRLHPILDEFLAQTQGGYVAVFSAKKPFRMNAYKCFQGHQVLGYNVGFDVSRDGSFVVSGSSDGHLYCYCYSSGQVWQRIEELNEVCTDIAFHPVLPSTLAACTWSGRIVLLD